MKHQLTAALFVLVTLGTNTVQAGEPATIPYTTSGAEPIMSIEDALAANPDCPEQLRLYGEYSRIGDSVPCGKPQRRDRLWICNDGTGNQGVDIEIITIPCELPAESLPGS